MTDSRTFQLRTDAIGKSFGRRVICRSVTLELALGESLAVVGPNGSGKSTFVKILAGLARPDRGTVSYLDGGVVLKPEQRFRYLGMVSPDLALYEELTANENLRFAADVMGLTVSDAEIDGLLAEFGLLGRGHDDVRTYSSGMRHRLKFVAALLKNPQILLLDEPTVMLDDDGATRVWHALSRRNLAVVIATSDSTEAQRADRQIVMGADGA